MYNVRIRGGKMESPVQSEASAADRVALLLTAVSSQGHTLRATLSR